jgi:hypothetical protein
MVELVQTAQEIDTAVKKKRFPRSVRKDCNWDCEYKDLCIVQLFGGDISTMVKKNFQPRGRRDV